jgi:hypothetical protein
MATLRVGWKGTGVSLVMAAIIILIIMIGVCGCMKNNTNQGGGAKVSELSVREQVMEYINSRYDDHFTFYGREPGMYRMNDIKILGESEKYPGEYITVLYSKSSEDGTVFLNDNYLYFKYREQTIEFLEGVLREFFNYDLKFFYDMVSAGVNLLELPADATFEEYISNKASRLRFTAVIAPGYDTGDGVALTQRLKEVFAAYNTVILGASVLFCDDPETYSSLDSRNISIYRAKYKGTAISIARLNTGADRYEWREI